jgi:hypothetical protein
MTAEKRGRKPTYVNQAERQKAYRERKKEFEKQRKNKAVPLISSIIDLSAVKDAYRVRPT